MCRRITCKQCQRPSYAGCGAHVEQVLGDVAPPDRCQCQGATRAARPSTSGGRRWPWSRKG